MNCDAMIPIPQPSPALRKALAWAMRILGLYVVVAMPWWYWRAYVAMALR